ncbi:hypothetical protein PV327_003263 [Microctonus hyperodae]|uniref:HTH psq-type domain-containing protein n=1 Tax=Microctonus hyperodae TaxID=165561 RepID=A0AA39G595_MICHY|nr:hypothetical protein PV327_003263 [Microctonus hyperodae]
MSQSYLQEKSGVFNKEKLVEAINMVRKNKMSCSKAAKCFNVPRTILFCLCKKNEATVTTSEFWSLFKHIFCDVVFIPTEQSDAVKDDCTNITGTMSTSPLNKNLSFIDIKLPEIYSSRCSIYPFDHIKMILTEVSIPRCKSEIKIEVSPIRLDCGSLDLVLPSKLIHRQSKKKMENKKKSGFEFRDKDWFDSDRETDAFIEQKPPDCTDAECMFC